MSITCGNRKIRPEILNGLFQILRGQPICMPNASRQGMSRGHVARDSVKQTNSDVGKNVTRREGRCVRLQTFGFMFFHEVQNPGQLCPLVFALWRPEVPPPVVEDAGQGAWMGCMDWGSKWMLMSDDDSLASSCTYSTQDLNQRVSG